MLTRPGMHPYAVQSAVEVLIRAVECKNSIMRTEIRPSVHDLQRLQIFVVDGRHGNPPYREMYAVRPVAHCFQIRVSHGCPEQFTVVVETREFRTLRPERQRPVYEYVERCERPAELLPVKLCCGYLTSVSCVQLITGI